MSKRRLSRNAVFREIVLDILSDGSEMYLRDICPIVETRAPGSCWGKWKKGVHRVMITLLEDPSRSYRVGQGASGTACADQGGTYVAKKIAMGFAHGGVFLLAVIVFYLGLGVGLQISSTWGTALWIVAAAMAVLNVLWMIRRARKSS